MRHDYVKLNEECKDRLIEGVNLIADAVSKTFGPNGTNVVIRTGASLQVTKDGVTVANSVNDPDQYVQMGIDIMKEAAKKTADVAGDNTTTSIILARSIVEEYKDEDNPIFLTRKLREDCNKVIEFLETQKKEASSYDDILKVATLSANNDEVIGKLVADAFDKVGKEGIVTFEESEDVNDKIDFSNGFRIDRGYSSPYFINTSKGSCELEDVYVYISDIKMEELKEVVKIADEAVKAKKSLLLIAPEFDSEILVFLHANLDLLKSCTIISPNNRAYREIALKDIRTLLGSEQVCDKVIITKTTTTFIGCKGDEKEIEDRVNEIRKIVEDNSLTEFDMNFHKKRLANFTSGIATIYVGGYTKVEMLERKDRVEDAIRSAHAALNEGILPGSGSVYKVPKDISGTLYNTLFAPITNLNPATNPDNLFYDGYACVKISEDPELGEFWEGINLKDSKIGDLYEMGVVDSFIGIKSALENAVSAASLILTCKCAILNVMNYGE